MTKELLLVLSGRYVPEIMLSVAIHLKICLSCKIVQDVFKLMRPERNIFFNKRFSHSNKFCGISIIRYAQMVIGLVGRWRIEVYPVPVLAEHYFKRVRACIFTAIHPIHEFFPVAPLLDGKHSSIPPVSPFFIHFKI